LVLEMTEIGNIDYGYRVKLDPLKWVTEWSPIISTQYIVRQP
jgi:hypothetical protein